MAGLLLVFKRNERDLQRPWSNGLARAAPLTEEGKNAFAKLRLFRCTSVLTTTRFTTQLLRFLNEHTTL